ncbi:MAG: DUF975 family protein [Eubacteriaceae bacterium]
MDYLSNDQIKRKALDSLNNNWGKALAILIITWIITQSVSQINSHITSYNVVIGNFNYYNQKLNFIGVIQALIAGPIIYGRTFFYLNIIRNNDGKVKDVFKGFDRLGSSLILGLLITLFTSLWTLLLIIPGIIAAIRYSMAYYLMVDYEDLSAINAISLSSEMMKGHKTRYINLIISFIGWYLLSLVTFGIALFYVIPYLSAAETVFYQELISKTDTSLINMYIEK